MIHLHFVLAWVISGMFSPAVPSHEYYLSVCQVDYNRSAASLEVTMKIFTDDLELTLKNNGAGDLFLGTDREKPNSDQALENYIGKHFSLKVDGKTVEGAFLGKEVELDITWVYIEVKGIQPFKQLEVHNSVLMDTFEKQTNLVNVLLDQEKKSLLLNASKKTGSVSF